MRKALATLSVLVLTASAMAQYVSVARNKGTGGSGSVTPSFICSNWTSGSTTTCSAVGTPTAGGKAVVWFESFATASPTSGNTSCTNTTGGTNTWTFRGGNTTANYIALWDATLTNVASGMTFSCTSTQTGFNFGTQIHVFLLTGWSSGIDAGPTFSTAASSNVNWATSNITPTITGDALLSFGAWSAGTESTLSTSTSGWSLGTVQDATDVGLGPGVGGYNGPYNSTTATSMTFHCTAGTCTTDTPNTAIVAYK